jgi:hypothetical protein
VNKHWMRTLTHMTCQCDHTLYPKRYFANHNFGGIGTETNPTLHTCETPKPNVGPLSRTRSNDHVPSLRSTDTIALQLHASRYRDYLYNTSRLLQLLNPEMSRSEIKRSTTPVDLDPTDTIPPRLYTLKVIILIPPTDLLDPTAHRTSVILPLRISTVPSIS